MSSDYLDSRFGITAMRDYLVGYGVGYAIAKSGQPATSDGKPQINYQAGRKAGFADATANRAPRYPIAKLRTR
jgi:hypothetical protein